MRRLEGKSVLVLGAGGVGSGLVRRYAGEGARVFVGDLDLASASAAASAAESPNASVTPLQVDGADEGSLLAALAACNAQAGGIDGLHLNFASFVDSDDAIGVEDLPLDVFDETIRVNQRGFFLCTRAVLPHLIERGGGVILYTSSIAAYRGHPTRVAYAMAKSAIHALMRHVAKRHGSNGIRANVVAPGTIMHGKWEEALPEDMKRGLMSSAVIQSRLGRPDDIAAMSALLMSEEGSYITGQVVCVDGGVTMRA
jgi:NAD(P)-dependent dehydrogenase (short-subunit alcohol dehydrogenase family)